MSWTADIFSYQQFVSSFEKDVKLVTKDSWFWKFLSWFPFIFTFGSFKRESFLQDFASTIGPLIAIPKEWSSISKSLLVHEIEHYRQMKKCGLGFVWLGVLVFFFTYIFLFPIGFNYFRYKWELNADKIAWQYMIKHKFWKMDEVRERAIHFANIVGSSAYGWPLPVKYVMKGFLNEVARLEKSLAA